MADDKGSGRGRGKFTAAGVQADQEARLSAVEDYLADQIEAGVLPPPVIDEPAPEDDTSA